MTLTDEMMKTKGIYKGEIKDGKAYGEGEWRSEKYRYWGTWVDNKWTGYGKYSL